MLSRRHRPFFGEIDQATDVAIDVPDPNDQKGDAADDEADQQQVTRGNQDAPQDGPPEAADHPGMMAVHDRTVVAALHVVDDERHDTQDAGDGAEQMQYIRHDGDAVAFFRCVHMACS